MHLISSLQWGDSCQSGSQSNFSEASANFTKLGLPSSNFLKGTDAYLSGLRCQSHSISAEGSNCARHAHTCTMPEMWQILRRPFVLIVSARLPRYGGSPYRNHRVVFYTGFAIGCAVGTAWLSCRVRSGRTVCPLVTFVPENEKSLNSRRKRMSWGNLFLLVVLLALTLLIPHGPTHNLATTLNLLFRAQ